MNTDKSAAAHTHDQPFTSFWAVWIVFATLAVLQASYCLEDSNQRSRLEAADVQLKTALARATTVSRTMDAVGREVLALASDSPEAAKIAKIGRAHV